MSKVTPRGKVPQRNISFTDDQWAALGTAADDLGVSRGEVIRHLVALGWKHTSCDVPFDPRLPGERSPFRK